MSDEKHTPTEKLDELAALEPGWAHGDEPIISKKAIATARAVLSHKFTTADANVVPTVHGGVQLEWYKPSGEVELEISPDGSMSYLATPNKDGRNIDWDSAVEIHVPNAHAALLAVAKAAKNLRLGQHRNVAWVSGMEELTAALAAAEAAGATE